MELNRVMKRVREVSRVGPGTDDEGPEPVDRGKPTGEVGRLGRLRPVEGLGRDPWSQNVRIIKWFL